MKANKRWLMVVMLCFCFLSSVILTTESANAAAKVTWSSVGKGSYNELSPYTLNWTGDVMSNGGYSLLDMAVTSSSSDAHFVITQSGYIAANGILKLNENLQDETDASIASFKSYENVTQGAVYLIVLSDGTWVKLRIDSVVESYMGYISKVNFSFVVEDEVIEEEQPTSPRTNRDYKPGQFAEDVEQGLYENPFADPEFDLRYPGKEYTFEEGPIRLTYPALSSQIAFDIYRSDNGGAYVPVSDFILEEPEFIDNYVFPGHTYLYIFVAYDQYGVSEIDLPIKVNIVGNGSDNPSTPASDTMITMKLDSKTARVGNKNVTLDVAPMTINGRTMVPLRFISESLGADVKWDGSTRSVTIVLGNQKITLQLDRSNATVNGKQVMMDVPATTMMGRTMVPIRFVGESLDLDVKFHNATREITIQGKQSSTPSRPTTPTTPTTPSTPTTPTPTPTQQPSTKTPSDIVGIWEMWVPSEDYRVPSAPAGYLIVYDDMTWEKGDESGVIEQESGRYILRNYAYGWDWYINATDDGIRVSSPPAYHVGIRAKF